MSSGHSDEELKDNKNSWKSVIEPIKQQRTKFDLSNMIDEEDDDEIDSDKSFKIQND